MTSLDLQSRKLWLMGGAVLALLILLAFWLLAIHPKRSDAASLRSQTADTQLQNAQLEAQNAALVRQSQHVGGYQTKLAKALAALPSQSGLSVFTQSLTADARAAGVQLTSISVGAPSAAAAAATVAPTPEATDSDSDSTETSVAPTAAPTVAPVGPLSTTFTLQASGTTAQELAFLSAVRTGPRSALITSAQFSAGTAGTAGTPNTVTAQVNIFNSAQSAAQLSQLRQLLDSAK